jgi:hypothetical protein
MSLGILAYYLPFKVKWRGTDAALRDTRSLGDKRQKPSLNVALQNLGDTNKDEAINKMTEKRVIEWCLVQLGAAAWEKIPHVGGTNVWDVLICNNVQQTTEMQKDIELQADHFSVKMKKQMYPRSSLP